MSLNLGNQKRLVHPEACFVCKWAGFGAVTIWPQQKEGVENRWAVYVKVNPRIRPDTSDAWPQGLRSGHRNIGVCLDHWVAVNQAWVNVAWDEVQLQDAWDAYIERTER